MAECALNSFRRSKAIPVDSVDSSIIPGQSCCWILLALRRKSSGKEDTAKELQDHAAKTQDTLVDAVENAEVAEIKRAVFRAPNLLL